MVKSPNIEPTWLPKASLKGPTYFGEMSKTEAPDLSKSPRSSNISPGPSQNPPKTPARPNFDQPIDQKSPKNR